MPAFITTFTTAAGLLTILAYQCVFASPLSSVTPNTTTLSNTSGFNASTTTAPPQHNSTGQSDQESETNQGNDNSQTLPGQSTATQDAITDNAVDNNGDNTTRESESSKHGERNEDEKKEEEEEEEHEGVELIVLNWKDVEYPFIVTLVIIFVGLSKLGFHYSHFLSSKVPESW